MAWGCGFRHDGIHDQHGELEPVRLDGAGPDANEFRRSNGQDGPGVCPTAASARGFPHFSYDPAWHGRPGGCHRGLRVAKLLHGSDPTHDIIVPR